MECWVTLNIDQNIDQNNNDTEKQNGMLTNIEY